MPHILTALGSLFYMDAGSGPGMVFIGGLSATSTAWQSLQRRFSSSCRVICFDNPGVGKSEQPTRPYTLEQVADAFAEALAALDARDLYVVGHSMGGCIAMTLAAQHPRMVKQLVLANTLAQPRELRENHFEQLRSARLTLSAEEWLTRFYQKMILPTRFANKSYRNALVSFALQNPQSDVSFFAQMDALLAFDGTAYLQAVASQNIPVLLLSSQQDILIPPQRTFALKHVNPSWQTTLIPDAAHASYIENYRGFCNALETFGEIQ
ncbi:MAG: alpha/beta hydrolase [Candidatus Cloacimonetes bacterium]|nr:alpha/beta hydrolase [Candidatus Cloacimonadota bacterium]